MERSDIVYGVTTLQPEFCCRLQDDPAYRWWHWRSLIDTCLEWW